MYIIVVAWIYVVFMMSVTEKNVVAGIMTFLLYGLLPVSILVYLMRSGHRRRKRHIEEQQKREQEREQEQESPRQGNLQKTEE